MWPSRARHGAIGVNICFSSFGLSLIKAFLPLSPFCLFGMGTFTLPYCVLGVCKFWVLFLLFFCLLAFCTGVYSQCCLRRDIKSQKRHWTSFSWFCCCLFFYFIYVFVGMWALVYHVRGGERTSNSGCQARRWVYRVYGCQWLSSLPRGFWGTKLWLSGCVASAFLSWGSPRLGLLSNRTVKIMGILRDELKIEFCITRQIYSLGGNHTGML